MLTLGPFYRGDDHCFRVKIVVRDSQDVVDIRGWVFSSSLKLSSELPDQPELDDDGYRQVLKVVTVAPDNKDSEEGIAYILFPHEKTMSLIPTLYDVDIQVRYDNVIQTLLVGRIEILSDVTRDIDHE